MSSRFPDRTVWSTKEAVIFKKKYTNIFAQQKKTFNGGCLFLFRSITFGYIIINFMYFLQQLFFTILYLSNPDFKVFNVSLSRAYKNISRLRGVFSKGINTTPL